ncbi:MAG: hypothetical protein LBG76_00645 [Treponema sp.]|nr:hypothetical protein [Treponema sp.]
MKKIHRTLWSLALWIPVLSACACSTESAIQRILGGSSEAPVFLACKAVSATEITFQFSQPVHVSALFFDPPLEVASVNEGAVVEVSLKNPPDGGERVTADILVEDQEGNTLNVLVPFRTRNDNLPALCITEIRADYSKPKVEFVEFRTLEAGNLGALRIFTALGSLDVPLFEFPPVNVQAGEYIVLHLRNLYEGIDETGDDLAANPYTKENEALTDARDFWVPGTQKHLRKTDAVFLMDQDDAIVDALIFSENPDAWWKDEKLIRAAELLGRQKAWISPGESVPSPADAASSHNVTATRTLCRDEAVPDTNSPADWYITASSCASPGKANNTRRYTPKE